MFVLTHKIAGITIRTESDVLIPYLQEANFTKFEVKHDKYDVLWRFHNLDPGSFDGELSQDEVSSLAGCMRSGTDSILLRSPIVRNILTRCFNHPKETFIEIRSSTLSIFDYKSNIFDTFFLPDFEGNLHQIKIFPSLLSFFLPNFSAVILHASGIIIQDRVAVFMAPDGGGKSTIARNGSHFSILNDDQIILREQDDGFYVYGTPWGKTHPNLNKAKLGGFFLLEKAENFELIPQRALDIILYIYNENRANCIALSNKLRIKLFNILVNVCHQAPGYRLQFTKGKVDWEIITASMVV